MNRVSSMPSVEAATERGTRIRPAIEAATQIAYGRLDDEAAKVELLSRVGDESLLREAAIEQSDRRRDYIQDRVYRLLSASAAKGPVQPIPPEREELFTREATLGNLRMHDAFAQLATLEPALAGIETEVLKGDERSDRGCSPLAEGTQERLRDLVGGGANKDDGLLRSNLAGSIVNQYLQIIAGETHLGNAGESFFETPRKAFVAVVSIWRRPAR